MPVRHVLPFLKERYGDIGNASKVASIAAEFSRAFRAFRDVEKAVTVFGSARLDLTHPDSIHARNLGRLLAQEGYAVVTGAGPGIMEAVCRGAHEVKGMSIGASISIKGEREPNSFVDRLVHFENFFSRKVMLIHHSKAFVLLRGGFGTLDELGDVLTLIQTEKIARVPVILLGTDFWSPLLSWIQSHMAAEGLVSASTMELITLVETPEEALETIKKSQA